MTINIVWHPHAVTKDDRAKQKHQRPCILWFTGLSGSGKSTIASAVEQKLFKNESSGISSEPGFRVIKTTINIGRVTASITYNILLQMLSYHVALIKGTDVEPSRNWLNRLQWNR